MIGTKGGRVALLLTNKCFSGGEYRLYHHACKVLVVGGGTGGCAMAARFARYYKKPCEVILIEAKEYHLYQPLFTLIGVNLADIKSCGKLMEKVVPVKVKLLQDIVTSFDPKNNQVETKSGLTIQYDTMIIATGIMPYWNKIPGLMESIEDVSTGVCSIYAEYTLQKSQMKIMRHTNGPAIFTYPQSPVKCPGAPQKIMYLADDLYRRSGSRYYVSITYNTALPVIFGVKKYADALWKVCEDRGITVNTNTNLIKIDKNREVATFQKLTGDKETFEQEFKLLHVCPPMGPTNLLLKHPQLTDSTGFLDVDPKTLQHKKFSNIFGIGDCMNTPNSKTMAAVAAQSKVVFENLKSTLKGQPLKSEYNGYASCPLVTSSKKCILAEFDYNLQPRETFPFNQAQELRSMFYLKAYIFPFLYWRYMVTGKWNGPEPFRKLFSIFKRKEKNETSQQTVA